MSESEPTPPLTESARSVYEAARAVAGAWGGTFVALRRLLVADLALAREALVRGLVLLLLAAIMFGTMWVLLTAFMVWLLFKLGLGIGIALGLPLLVSAIIGVVAFLLAARALRLADMDASRRELLRWIEDARSMPGTEASTASEKLQPQDPPQP